MRYCSVKWCGNSARIKDGTTFHKFPTSPNMKQKWIEATNRDNWIPKNHSVICSRHFTEDSFRIMGDRRILYQSAVPTEMLPRLSYHQNISSVSSTSAESEAVPSTSRQHVSRRVLLNVPPNLITARERILYRAVFELSRKFRKCKFIIRRLRNRKRSLQQRMEALKRRTRRLQEELVEARENANL